MTRHRLAALTLATLAIPACAFADLSPVRALDVKAVNLAGLAYGVGHLWLTDLTSNTIYDLDPGSGAVLSTRPDLTGATGLAHDGVHLLTTNDAGTAVCSGANPNRIWKVDPATGAVLSSIPSPITGGGGGLGVMSGRLFAAGAYDQCNGQLHLEIVEVNPSTGAALGHFSVDSYGIGFARELDADASALLYVSSTSEPDTIVYRLFRFHPNGTLLRSDRLLFPRTMSEFDIAGLAWGNDEIFVGDRTARKVWVFSYLTGPTPSRQMTWGGIKTLYR